MALEVLHGVEKFGEFDIVDMDSLRVIHPERFNESGAMDYAWFEKDIRPKHFIYVRKDVNSISFTLQKGPIKEVGVNGCQVDTLIDAARAIIDGFQKKYPCEENKRAILCLDGALSCLAERKYNREKRGVEGTSER